MYILGRNQNYVIEMNLILCKEENTIIVGEKKVKYSLRS